MSQTAHSLLADMQDLVTEIDIQIAAIADDVKRDTSLRPRPVYEMRTPNGQYDGDLVDKADFLAARSAYAARTPNGQYLMADLLAAKANLLASMANLERSLIVQPE